MPTLVEIRPLPIEKWHGKSGSESFTRPTVIEALYDDSLGGYATGLTAEDIAKYEPILGVKLDNAFDRDIPHPTWSSKAFEIKLENNTMFLDIEKAINYIKVKIMKASKHVANSQKEYDEGKWPFATHIIFDEVEQIEEKATKVETKRRAYELTGKMSPDSIVALIQVMDNKTMRRASPNALSVAVGDLIEKDAQEVLRLIDLGKVEITIRAQVLECLAKNILTKEGSAILFMGEQIASNYDEAVSWFKDPNNSKMKVAILEKLLR